MKKVNFYLILTIVIVQVFIFKNSSSQIVIFGIKGGVNFSNITKDTPYKTKFKPGLSAYIFADFINQKIFTLSVEEGYTQKGFEVPTEFYNDHGETIGMQNVNANLEYTDLSVLAKFKIPFDKVTPYLIAGFSLGFKTGESVSPINSELQGPPTPLYYLSSFNNKTFGVKFGAGSEILLVNNIKLIFEAKYNLDHGTIGTIGWQSNGDHVRNKVFEIQTGIKF